MFTSLLTVAKLANFVQLKLNRVLSNIAPYFGCIYHLLLVTDFFIFISVEEAYEASFIE